MNRLLHTVIFLGICLFLQENRPVKASTSHHATTAYKVAVIIGNNRGARREKPLRYAKSDAIKFSQTLLELGGYRRSNIHLLLGANVQTIKKKLSQIRRALKKSQQKNPYRSTILLLYYSGHADNLSIHLGKSKLSFHWLRNWLKSSPAQIRLAFLDTCQSGQITRSKGAHRVSKEVPLPPVIRQTTTRGMAIITSSGIGEDSHELDQLRGSVFTHYLVSGLRGAADANQDGHVSLREAYTYTYQQTISHTLFLSSGIQHPSFRNELHGHGHFVLSDLKKSTAHIYFDTALEGTYFVLDKSRKSLLAELKKERGKAIQLSLIPGQYTVIRRNRNHYQVQTVTLRSGSRYHIKKKQMLALSYAWSASKGTRWLTRDLRPAMQQPSPYRSAFYGSIILASVGLLASGTLFAATGATIAANENYLATKFQYNPTLTARGQSLNTSAIISLAATGGATLSGLIFYLAHIHYVKQHKKKRSQPPTNTTLNRNNSLFLK